MQRARAAVKGPGAVEIPEQTEFEASQKNKAPEVIILYMQCAIEAGGVK
jgi:hypothetical protein